MLDRVTFVIIILSISVIGICEPQEFQVNSYFNGDQKNPSIILDENGNFLVTWIGEGIKGSFGVFAQKFDYKGKKVGDEFLIDKYIDRYNKKQDVALKNNGIFFMVWDTFKEESGYDIYGLSFSIEQNLTTEQVDYMPTLSEGQVIPEEGYQYEDFEYYVRFIDEDGGYAPITRLYINDVKRTMNVLTQSSNDHWYKLNVSGNELNIGDNEFYFFFVDDEGNWVRLPEYGTFDGPYVNENPFMTATATITQTSTLTRIPTFTSTPTYTKTPTISITPTITQTPEISLRITSPDEFYFNTIILSWTRIHRADHYKLDLNLRGIIHSFNIDNSWVIITFDKRFDWDVLVAYGKILHRVSVANSRGEVIDGPTDWFAFECK